MQFFFLPSFLILLTFTEVVKADESILISSSELNKLKEEKDSEKFIRIIETDFGPNGKEKYDKGHIPEAIYVDAAFNSTKTALIEFPLPNSESWEHYLGSLGISNDHFLIIYDRSDYGFKQSSRLRYLIQLFGKNNVRILNGGFNDWMRNKFQISTKSPQYSNENYKASYNAKIFRSYEDVVKNIDTQNEILIDARSLSEYQNGYIPNALNLPYNDFFDSKTGLIKTNEELMQMTTQRKIDLNKSIIAYCQSGVRASTLKLVLDLLGAKKVSVYNGSWYEYSQRSKSKINRIIENLEKILKSFFSFFFN